ncbi:hypothetical protein DFP72DRAFT_955797 [Ephemerocybe angulata]|uniref:NAD(P)-binding domain-containing protein n=1 Tax=Ephemerocybe angulata TaxID=980116 RepID=A0A8H6MGF9_9AGAR|nr:hypothetical protein DFP72DRAFT_955797 [Tulosesus angulatus]
MSLNVFAVGASRNIGYHSALRLLAKGATVTFLLRSPGVFDADTLIQEHIKSGKVRLVQGDALNASNVRAAWAEASKDSPVDVLLYTVGAVGGSFHPLKGVVIDPPNLVTQALTTVLCSMPKSTTTPPPKVIVVTASGVSRSSRKKTPLLLMPLYGYMISGPLQDKLGTERIAGHCAGWEWNPADGEPAAEVLNGDWKATEGLPAPGSLEDTVVLRPALLTDGECLADAAAEQGKALPYRCGPGEVGGYTVSRKDCAHFIVEGILQEWETWGGKQLSIAY